MLSTGKHSTHVIGAPHLRQTGTVTVCRNCSVLPATPFTVIGDTGDLCQAGLVSDSSIRDTLLRVSAAVTSDTASSVNVMKAGSSVFMLMADGLAVSCTPSMPPVVRACAALQVRVFRFHIITHSERLKNARSCSSGAIIGSSDAIAISWMLLPINVP